MRPQKTLGLPKVALVPPKRAQKMAPRQRTTLQTRAARGERHFLHFQDMEGLDDIRSEAERQIRPEHILREESEALVNLFCSMRMLLLKLGLIM